MTLAKLERWPAEREAERARIREETLRWVEAQPDEAAAIEALIEFSRRPRRPRADD